jgi:hypothetical protein
MAPGRVDLPQRLHGTMNGYSNHHCRCMPCRLAAMRYRRGDRPSARRAQMAAELEAAPRMGAERDEPEGARYVMVSDTLLRQIAETLRGMR